MDLSMLMELQPALSRRAPGQGRSDAFRLPGLLLLYVVAKNSREAVLRGGCLVQSLQHVLLDSTPHVAQVDAWRNMSQHLRKRDRSCRDETIRQQELQKRPGFLAWQCSDVALLSQVLPLTTACFAGGQLQRVCRASSQFLQKLKTVQFKVCQVDGSAAPRVVNLGQVSEVARLRMLQVPEVVADLLFMQAAEGALDSVPPLVTEAAVAAKLGILPAMEGQLFTEVAEAPEPVLEEASSSRSGPAREPMQDILCALLGFYLQNSRELPQVLSLAQRFLCPGLFTPELAVPGKDVLRNIMIKLDLLHSLSRRHFACAGDDSQPFVLSRYLSADSSPQAHQDYFCITEDILRRPRQQLCGMGMATADFDVFNNFEFESRSMPCTTFGRKGVTAAVKAARMVHVCCLEYGWRHMDAFRAEVQGFLSDQAVESSIWLFPIRDGHFDTPCDLPPAASAEGSSRPLFWNALPLSGPLHIIYNAMQEAVESCSLWQKFEEELRSVCKLFADKGFAEIIREQICADCSREELEDLKAFHVRLLDWRWESLEAVLDFWQPVHRWIGKYWRPDLLGRGGREHGLLVGSALVSLKHKLMLSFLSAFTRRVGRLVAWMEGCYCHDHLLTAAPSTWKRRRVMSSQDPFGLPTCKWKGRRLATAAMGQLSEMMDAARIEVLRHAGFTEFLLSAPPDAAAEMLAMAQGVTDQWLQQAQTKLAYYRRLPWKLAGGFSMYCGYSQEAAARCVRECIHEYDHGEADLQSAPLLKQVLGQGLVRRQLCAFAESKNPLTAYPLAFAAIQDRAFALLVERSTEREHSVLRTAATRGSRFLGPAMTCVRKRKEQILRMTKTEAGMAFLAMHWRDRDIFDRLLAHLFTPAQVRQLNMPQRCARVYCYSPQDHFVEEADLEEAGLALQDMHVYGQSQLRNFAMEHNQVLMFAKHHLCSGTVASLPHVLWHAYSENAEDALDLDSALPRAFTAEDIWQAFSLTGSPLESMDLETHEFFQVIDARPEQRKNMTFISATRSQTVLVVQRLMEAQVRRGSLLTAVVNPAAAEPSLLDLEALLRPAAFKDFCQGCLLWRQTESGALKLHLQQAPALQALPPMPLPPFICDSDPLEVLLPRKTALVESSLRPSLTVTACVPLTAEEEECVRALVDVGAVGAAERTGAFVASLPYFSEAAVRRLEDLQIVQRHVDEFQEHALALVCPLRLGATVSYADPVLVAAAWLNPSRALRSAVENKLVLLQELFRLGWKPQSHAGIDSKLVWLLPEQPRLLPSRILMRPSACLQALTCLAQIWEKGLQQLHMVAPETYYHYLLSEADLSGLNGLTEAELLNRFSRAASAPAAPRKGVRRRYCGKQAESEAVRQTVEKKQALQDLPAPAQEAMLQHGAEPAVPQLQLPREPPVQVRIPSLRDMQVHFDNYTHQSGRLRAFIACPLGKHLGKGQSSQLSCPQCRLYTFVDSHESRSLAVAFLIAWADAASRFSDGELHRAHRPSEAVVQAVLWRQAAGV